MVEKGMTFDFSLTQTEVGLVRGGLESTARYGGPLAHLFGKTGHQDIIYLHSNEEKTSINQVLIEPGVQ